MELPVNYDKLKPFEKRQVREEYVLLQKGKCAHCGTLLTDPPTVEITNAHINRDLFPIGFFTHPVHLHHDHNTGMTIGAVHNRCNAYLWQYLGE